jgi:hypothetical protein
VGYVTWLKEKALFLGKNVELEEEKTKMEGQRKDPRRNSNNYIRIK